MPKVLRIINRFNLGGPVYNAVYLSKYMSLEFETLLIGGMCSESEENSEYIARNLGLEPTIIPEMRREINPLNDIIAYQKIKKIIKEFKPDIVHTHASKAGALGRRAAYNLKVPVIVHTFHGHVFDGYFNQYIADYFKRVERKLARKSTKIIAISESQKEELAFKHHICSEKKITVIPLGFDLNNFHENMDEKRNEFRKKYFIEDDEIAIGIVGRVVPIKNHSLFIKAIKYLMDHSSKKIRAFIIGDGEDIVKIQKAATELNIDCCNFQHDFLKKTLTFTSWIKDIDYAMAGLDIITLTSLNEGTPVSLIEAKAANKPIVTTNVGGIKNMFRDGETALFSEVNDENNFFQNLLNIVENEKLRNQLSDGGWNLVKEKYHYTRLVQDMKVLYFDLLKG